VRVLWEWLQLRDWEDIQDIQRGAERLESMAHMSIAISLALTGKTDPFDAVVSAFQARLAARRAGEEQRQIDLNERVQDEMRQMQDELRAAEARGPWIIVHEPR
jgi:hypothetical protein